MSQNLLPPWLNSPYYTNLADNQFNQTQQNFLSLNNSLSPKKDVSGRGINGKNRIVSLPTYNAIDAAKTNEHNGSYITMAQDAPRGPGTGHSATGAPAASIDLVCGRVSAVAEAAKNSNLFVNDDFDHDAARLYISQTTDLDKACKLAEGDNPKFENRSGVAIIADNVAIKGRLGVKIVTSPNGDHNSKSGKISSGTGVELIANNNDSDLQPLVKGDNLIDCIYAIYKRIDKLADMVMDVAGENATLGLALGLHTHTVASTPKGMLAAPSEALAPLAAKFVATNINVGLVGGLGVKTNLFFDEFNYTYSLGNSYINSDFNRTN